MPGGYRGAGASRSLSLVAGRRCCRLQALPPLVPAVTRVGANRAAVQNASIFSSTGCADSNPANNATNCSAPCTNLFVQANTTCAGQPSLWNATTVAGCALVIQPRA